MTDVGLILRKGGNESPLSQIHLSHKNDLFNELLSKINDLKETKNFSRFDIYYEDSEKRKYPVCCNEDLLKLDKLTDGNLQLYLEDARESKLFENFHRMQSTTTAAAPVMFRQSAADLHQTQSRAQEAVGSNAYAKPMNDASGIPVSASTVMKAPDTQTQTNLPLPSSKAYPLSTMAYPSGQTNPMYPTPSTTNSPSHTNVPYTAPTMTYPSPQTKPGYPPPLNAYPSTQAGPSYPPPSSVYPPPQITPAYPPVSSAIPPQSTPAYPPSSNTYPSTQPGSSYPPPSSAYPPPQIAPTYPPVSTTLPPQTKPAYPPPSIAYPSTQAGSSYPPTSSAYPPPQAAPAYPPVSTALPSQTKPAYPPPAATQTPQTQPMILTNSPSPSPEKGFAAPLPEECNAEIPELSETPVGAYGFYDEYTSSYPNYYPTVTCETYQRHYLEPNAWCPVPQYPIDDPCVTAGLYDPCSVTSYPPVIVCNDCGSPITDLRYKCLTCVDYDICCMCESQGAHSHHNMVRLPCLYPFSAPYLPTNQISQIRTESSTYHYESTYVV